MSQPPGTGPYIPPGTQGPYVPPGTQGPYVPPGTQGPYVPPGTQGPYVPPWYARPVRTSRNPGPGAVAGARHGPGLAIPSPCTDGTTAAATVASWLVCGRRHRCGARPGLE
jgi:hypothetical protein